MCDRCEELEEKVRQLESELYNTMWEAPPELGLTSMEARILSVLVAHERPLAQSFLITATRDCAGIKGDFPNKQLIDAKICHMRRKMRAFGLGIETIWGRGFRLEAESRTRLRNWNVQRAEAA